MLGFPTAEPPETIRESADTPSMRTLFVPHAPNPVMGGFIFHLPDGRVHDVDLTVEEGVQSIVTSGAALDPRVDYVDVASARRIGGAQYVDGDLVDWETLGPYVLTDEGDEEPGRPS